MQITPVVIQNADRVIAKVADIETLTGSIRGAEIIDSWREVVAALVRLRAFTLGQSTALEKIISLVNRMERILRYEHSKLLNQSQDDWKAEIQPGKDLEFKRLVKEFLAEVRNLK